MNDSHVKESIPLKHLIHDQVALAIGTEEVSGGKKVSPFNRYQQEGETYEYLSWRASRGVRFGRLQERSQGHQIQPHHQSPVKRFGVGKEAHQINERRHRPSHDGGQGPALEAILAHP